MCRVQTNNRMTEAMEERERKYEEKEGKGRRKKKEEQNERNCTRLRMCRKKIKGISANVYMYPCKPLLPDINSESQRQYALARKIFQAN